MKLHTVFITHNRMELSRKAIVSYLSTVTVPFTFVVVDNASTDGTQEWLLKQGWPVILLNENRYPGFACNRGWELAPEDATHLQRADNDFMFHENWCDHIEHIFKTKKIGQVGLRTGPEEMNAKTNVGGNCIIRKELWDQGLRYDERPWTEYPPGWSEDSLFSPEVEKMGYTWTRVKNPTIISLASGDLNDPYYQKSYGERGIITMAPHLRSELGLAD